MIQEKRDSKGIFTAKEELSSKGMKILHQLWSNNATTNRSTKAKDLSHNPLRVHEPLAIERLHTMNCFARNLFTNYMKKKGN